MATTVTMLHSKAVRPCARQAVEIVGQKSKIIPRHQLFIFAATRIDAVITFFLLPFRPRAPRDEWVFQPTSLERLHFLLLCVCVWVCTISGTRCNWPDCIALEPKRDIRPEGS